MTRASQASLYQNFQKLLDATGQATPCAPGIILQIEAPYHNLKWTGASGYFARGSTRKLTALDAFRLASVTKTVTAATLLKLAEQGRLNLDDTIERYLPPQLVNRLHNFDRVSYGSSITVRQLLNHTSGLYDYITDQNFTATLMADPKRSWTPAELVEQATVLGKPYFPPGQGYHYSDTNYVLAALIAQVVSDQPLQNVYREFIFKPLEMNQTYLEGYETPNNAGISHHYMDELDVTEVNPTFDWGGGGLVSTAGDLSRFIHGLFSGQLLNGSSLKQMLNWISTGSETSQTTDNIAHYSHYGLGLGLSRFNEAGLSLPGHTGSWGAFIYYWPQYQVSIAGTFNLYDVNREPLISEVMGLLQAYLQS